MKFLFATLFAESVSLAQRLLDEGHAVRFFIKEPSYRRIGQGLVPKVQDWKTHIPWADVIVFDDAGLGKEMDRLRKKGYAVAGGNAFGDKLENDRLFGQRIMAKAGIRFPASFGFRSFRNAISFIQKRPRKYIIKFNGQVDRELCYMSRVREGDDLIGVLEHYKGMWPARWEINFILQEVIDGIEMAAGAFFNGKDFVFPVNVTFEHKHLLAGGVGPFTGEMGTSMYYHKDGGKLFRETLAKMKPFLARTNYRGFIDINSMVTKKGAYALEFTSRFGYPQIDIQQELHVTPWGKLLYELAHGTLTHFKTHPGFAVGVVLGGAGMPYQTAYNKYGKDLPILGVNEKNRRHVRLTQAYQKDEKLYSAGGRDVGGYVATITGRGKTMTEAQKNAYGVMKQIAFPNAVYRVDIGNHWKTEAKKLKTWGYL